ncbi:hypothetical protein B0H13DRAFT_2386620 [Mycena leptocephala]|nr:hypothetical protein B0H13DRAFT_2386620 [Mycena leptocephala]
MSRGHLSPSLVLSTVGSPSVTPPPPLVASGLTSHSDYYSAGHDFSSASRQASPVPSAQPLQARYVTGSNGQMYLVEESTGLPVVILGELPSLDATSARSDMDLESNTEMAHQDSDSVNRSPSSTSQPSFSPSNGTPPRAENLEPSVAERTESPDKVVTPFTELVSRIPEGALSSEDMAQLHNFRGVITTSRDHLLSSTVLMAKQHEALGNTHADIVQFRNQAASRLASLHNEVTSGQSKINRCLLDNIKVLREMGASEAALTELMSSVSSQERTGRPGAPLPKIAPIHQRAVQPPPDIQAEMNHIVAPQGEGETNAEFEQRTLATIRRKERASAAFSIPQGNLKTGDTGSGRGARTRDETPPLNRPVDRGIPPVEDIGSISMAMRSRDVRFGVLPASRAPATLFAGLSQNASGYQSVGSNEEAPVTVFDEFTKDMARVIRRIIARHLGTTMTLPSHFLERICQLEGYALEWITELLENQHDESGYDLPHELTFANATVDFEKVKYDPATGPDRLMNDLIKYGARMREKPSPFTIRSAFFRALPDDMYNKLVVDRGFTPEYSSAADLLDHARQLWVGVKLARGRRTTSAPSSTQGNRPAPTRSTTTSGSRATSIPMRKSPMSDLRDGSGAATRVIESYSDGETIPIESDEVITGDTIEPWGGSQYESGPDDGSDPNTAPDLDQLVEVLDDGGEDNEEPRVAAMRRQYQYYAMRVVELDDDEFNADASPPLTPEPVADTSVIETYG